MEHLGIRLARGQRFEDGVLGLRLELGPTGEENLRSILGVVGAVSADRWDSQSLLIDQVDEKRKEIGMLLGEQRSERELAVSHGGQGIRDGGKRLLDRVFIAEDLVELTDEPADVFVRALRELPSQHWPGSWRGDVTLAFQAQGDPPEKGSLSVRVGRGRQRLGEQLERFVSVHRLHV